MQIVQSIKEMQKLSRQFCASGKRIGFVPTMGYLHEGHLSLVQAANRENDVVFVSIFVNPTQFSPNEDLTKYPRDFDRDYLLLSGVGVAAVFYPPVEEIYPNGAQTSVLVYQKTKQFEGEFRPTHFEGVTTVVSILLNATLPDRMYLGQKDAQQASVLKQMAHDLHFPTEIVVVPTVRESDGLAKSSRNVYLSQREREQSALIYQALRTTEQLILNNINIGEALEAGKRVLSGIEGISIEYFAVAEEETFTLTSEIFPGKTYFIITAVRINGKRLIDNVVFSV